MTSERALEDYLIPIDISQNAMARAIGVAPPAINEIVHGKRAITPQMSIRFGAFFGQSEDFWHGIQVECDFRALRVQMGAWTCGPSGGGGAWVVILIAAGDLGAVGTGLQIQSPMGRSGA